MPAFRNMLPIPESSLTAAQRATLSNTICGDVLSARQLEHLGLLEIRRIDKTARGSIAYFDLTAAGEEFVQRYYVIPDCEGADE